MSKGINKAIILGRCGNDPEIRYTQSGDAIANLSIATTEQWKDKSGQKQERTEWHRCVAYRKLAEIIGNYIKKGSLVYVEGKIQTRKWTDNNNVERYSTEIVINELQMLDSKPQGQGVGSNQNQQPAQQMTGQQAQQPQGRQQANEFDPDEQFDDDIPW